MKRLMKQEQKRQTRNEKGWELLKRYEKLDTKKANDWLASTSGCKYYTSPVLHQCIYTAWRNRQ